MTTDQGTNKADRVVVGVDGSESSKHALRWAQFIASASSSTLEVVAAWQTYTAYSWAAMPADWNPAQDAETALNSTVDEVLGKADSAGLTRTVRGGNAGQILLEASVGARMLVVGSRGHGGFAGLLLGSVSAACAAHATCPVLILHGDTPAPSW